MQTGQRSMVAATAKPDGVTEQRHPLRVRQNRLRIVRTPRRLYEIAVPSDPHSVGDVAGVLGVLIEDREDVADLIEIGFGRLLDDVIA